MLEIIIALLMSLGVNFSEGTNINVVDQQTGITYGVGSTVIITQGSSSPAPTITYVLMQDANGEYYLVRR